ncbi:histidine kinase [Nostoc minutum NIES-26]|uniref:Histidine kinase n=1 Tax=Nostoc minutum NIES-26 TaxID=1844469 RepID=A0A367QKY1_9NOSO|nr:histidine kinase [Nostoc minutum NIES-26]
MAKRSLQASEEGIRKAKQAFKRKGWTQEYLAAEVSLETRQPIWKFFTGKPVDRHVFNDICFVLELDPLEIIQKPNINEYTSLDTPADTTLDIHALVQKLRSVYHEKIQAQCGTLHLLDIARPINLNELYVDVNIFEELTSKRWLEIIDLHRLDTDEFKRFGLSQSPQELISGLDLVIKYSKLMLLGKPGSGKTTFLQSIAISCIQGIILPDYLPIFITLKNFAEDIQGRNQISFLNYLHEYFINFGISEQEMATLFSHGKALILLDGLDEVLKEDSGKIINIIRKFSDKYYKNKIVIACRIASYYYNFPGFTEVEIADFNKPQIAEFTEKWFLAVARNSPAEAQTLAHKFIQKLELVENLQILELVTTPLLLNLICLVFKSMQDFPANRCELYKQALDLLLVRWDETRSIKRDRVYRDLSLLHKIKLLSHIAAVSLNQGDYFLPETKMRQLIADYLRYLPDAATDADALELESVAVLKAIAAQHGLLIERTRGIYSFSHLIFQEYFAAREIITNPNTQNLQEFVNRLGKKHWRNVFLLSVEMLNPADTLLQLMKQKIDNLATSNAKLHDFLIWLGHKSSIVDTFYHVASVRAFYFTIALPPEHPLACNQDLAMSLDRRLALNLALDLGLDLALIHALTVSLAITADIFFQRFSALSLALDLRHLLTDKPSLQKSLQELKNQLPLPSKGREALKIWWQANGKAWTGELRTLIICTRQIGHDWEFNEQDLEQLQYYWDANKLVLDCLNSGSNVTPNVRDCIKENLFLIYG